jgi:transposase
MNKIIPSSTKTASAKATIPSLTIGIDLGDRWSQLCLLNVEGQILEQSRVKSTPHSFTQRFAALAPARIAIEVGTHSPWVKELLTELGHEVLVANARELRAISTSDRKNDKADAEKLARYARVDPAILRPIVHRDSQTHADLLVIRARAALIRMRSLAINAVRGLVKPFGHRLSACSSDSFVTRCRTELPSEYYTLLAPLLEQIASLSKQIHSADQQVAQLTKAKYPEAASLQKVPGVGPLTALTFVLTIGDEKRFSRSRDVGCYLGLRPRQQQSGERDPQLGITKAGDGYLRLLLVECAQHVLGVFGPDTALRRWGLRLAERGGKNAKKRAIVAVARKLAVLLHRLWVTKKPYEPFFGIPAPIINL